MDAINRAIYEIEDLNETAIQDKWINNINPTIKLFITVFYLCVTISFDKYNPQGILSMAIYPILMFFIGDLSFKSAFYRLRLVLPIVFVMGIFNPFFDREVAGIFLGISISSGMLSMLSLILKGLLSVFAAYILVASTSIEKICYSLKFIHLPEIFITQIMLTFRYILVLLEEVKKIKQSYTLRAPGQKGVHFKAWGSLTGNLLLRTLNRAEELYESMCLRGYRSSFFVTEKSKLKFSDFIFLIITSVSFIIFRIFPIFTLVGNFISIFLNNQK
ncbi:MAG: cobalt ECF transporter T component CbiQ [Treponemataceae bacterium]